MKPQNEHLNCDLMYYLLISFVNGVWGSSLSSMKADVECRCSRWVVQSLRQSMGRWSDLYTYALSGERLVTGQ